jgi:hypothetical protein
MKTSHIIYFLLAIFALFIFALYEALRTKKTVVSNKSPFVEIIGKKLTLKRDAFLAKNLEEFSYEEIYYLSEDRKNIFEGVKIVAELKAGTEIVIKSATFLKNGTSGITRSNVVGSVYVDALKKEINFEYEWGNFRYSLYEIDNDEYWTFPKAIWQEEQDYRKYFKN